MYLTGKEYLSVFYIPQALCMSSIFEHADGAGVLKVLPPAQSAVQW